VSRPRAGYIGFNRVPDASAINSAASGIWTLREAEAMRRAGTWPSVPTAPGTPTALSATGGNAQVSLAWTAPASNGGSAITDYAVQFSSNSGSTWTTFADGTSTATSATVTGLTNGTAYVFRVAAVNAVDTGAYTSPSSSVTPSAGTPPNAPTGLTATAGNAQIALAWTAPSAPGTSAITGYTVEYTPSGGSAQTVSTGSTSTSYTLTGLTNGTAYTVRVAGVSAAGAGAYTAASSSVTPSAATVPGAVQGLSAAFSCGSGNFCASWTAPSSNGGSPITGYRVQATGDINASINVIVTSTSWASAFIHSNCGGNGTLTISAINAIGQGPSETRSGSWGYCD